MRFPSATSRRTTLCASRCTPPPSGTTSASASTSTSASSGTAPPTRVGTTWCPGAGVSLLGTLKIGNIDTWVAYDQFVTRGLKPAFDFIDGVGERLVGLRARLQSVLEGIETSALVIQTSATRSNTAQLRRVATRFRIQNVILVVISALFATDTEVRLNLMSVLQAYMIWLWELGFIHFGRSPAMPSPRRGFRPAKGDWGHGLRHPHPCEIAGSG
jgi:hypothetical protein